MNNSPFTFVSDKILDSLIWKEHQKTAPWCEENIVMSSETSGRAGALSFERYPWSEEILEDWDRDNLEEYSMEASTQVAKTTIQFCCIVKPLVEDPCMMMFVMASDKMVSDFVAEKFDPFVDGIHSLKEKISSKQEEDSLRLKNAVKIVPGGRISFVGNTAINRRGKTVKYVFMDEVALYNHSDVEEFKSRTKSFEGLGRKIFIVSSPMHFDDPIHIAYEDAYCKKELHIECNSCKKSFYPTSKHFKYMSEEEYKTINDDIDFKHLDYKREAIKTAHIECECSNKITFEDLEQSILEKKVRLVIVDGNPEIDTKIGYKLNALATGLSHYSKMAEKLIEAKQDDEKLAGIYREYFNEIYEINLETSDKNDILLLSNNIPEWVIPEDTIPHGVVMGVDSQKNHYWYEIKAYQYGMKSNTISAGRVETLNEIERLFEKTYYDKDGNEFYIERMGIDRQGYVKKETVKDEDGNDIVVETENNIDLVDEWCMNMVEKWGEDRIYPTIGVDKITGDLMYKFSTIDKDFAKTRVPIPLKALKISNLRAKNTLNQSIQNTIKKVKGESEVEQRLFYINQTIVDEINLKEKSVSTDYHRQYTSEVFTYGKTPSGKLKTEKSWVKQYNDNHLWDTGATCTALAHLLRLEAEIKPEKTEDNSFLSSFDKLM